MLWTDEENKGKWMYEDREAGETRKHEYGSGEYALILHFDKLWTDKHMLQRGR